MTSCRMGVDSPTRKLKAQLVAVESDTPLARTVSGIISAGNCKKVSTNFFQNHLDLPATEVVPSYIDDINERLIHVEIIGKPVSKCGIENNDTDHYGSRSLWNVNI